jgi:hypothetical protein
MVSLHDSLVMDLFNHFSFYKKRRNLVINKILGSSLVGFDYSLLVHIILHTYMYITWLQAHKPFVRN